MQNLNFLSSPISVPSNQAHETQQQKNKTKTEFKQTHTMQYDQTLKKKNHVTDRIPTFPPQFQSRKLNYTNANNNFYQKTSLI